MNIIEVFQGTKTNKKLYYLVPDALLEKFTIKIVLQAYFILSAYVLSLWYDLIGIMGGKAF